MSIIIFQPKTPDKKFAVMSIYSLNLELELSITFDLVNAKVERWGPSNNLWSWLLTPHLSKLSLKKLMAWVTPLFYFRSIRLKNWWLGFQLYNDLSSRKMNYKTSGYFCFSRNMKGPTLCIKFASVMWQHSTTYSGFNSQGPICRSWLMLISLFIQPIGNDKVKNVWLV